MNNVPQTIGIWVIYIIKLFRDGWPTRVTSTFGECSTFHTLALQEVLQADGIIHVSGQVRTLLG
jgi:hypothetical protein